MLLTCSAPPMVELCRTFQTSLFPQFPPNFASVSSSLSLSRFRNRRFSAQCSISVGISEGGIIPWGSEMDSLENAEALQMWLSESGLPDQKMGIDRVEIGERGLVALKNIRKREKLLFVLPSLVITSDSEWTIKEAGDVMKKYSVPDWPYLATYLISEASAMSLSRWSRYISALPRQLYSLLYWIQSELDAFLVASPIRERAIERINDVIGMAPMRQYWYLERGFLPHKIGFNRGNVELKNGKIFELNSPFLAMASKSSGVDGIGGGNVKISPEVLHALSRGDPVVALESTIISHGMPYPQNFQTAKDVEAVVRENGAIPATIAILGGVPHIGLNEEELEMLAVLGRKAQKTSRRDISQVVATGRNGATTVSATMFFASKVGIHIFVTGGIGGVHRHGEQTMDISSDLTELGRTPVAVISAGVKSILDIPRTLEFLETQGVTVAAYKTHKFPAFFTESSGSQVSCRVDSPEECAKLINASLTLGLGNGTLIAVPIPEEHAASGKLIESAILKALEEAAAKNVTGSEATPFLLARVNELTGGESLAANIALVKNNALIGAKIAVALARLRKEG